MVTRIIIGILVLLFIFMQNLITKLSDKNNNPIESYPNQQPKEST